MKLTQTGYRINKNGKVITSIESDALVKLDWRGSPLKENGTYYFFSRKQGDLYIYLP